MNVTNSPVKSFDVDRIDFLFNEAIKPNETTTKINALVQELMLKLSSGDVLIVKEVLDSKNKAKWMHIIENMQKIAPGAMPQFNDLINRNQILGTEFQKVFQTNDPESMKKLWPLIMHAIDNQDFERLDTYIDLGLKLNSFCMGSTPLTYAVMKEKLIVIEYLIMKGANINLFDVNGFSPLKYAILQNKSDLADFLIKCGADVELLDNEKFSPIKYAIYQDKPNMVACLLKNKANPNPYPSLEDITLEEAGILQEPPLALAISLELPHIAEQLKLGGADADYAQSYLQETHLASVWGLEGYTHLTDKFGIEHRISLEGTSRRSNVLNHLTNYVETFFKNNDNAKIFLDALKNNSSLQSVENLQNAINKGVPAIILGGALDHCVGFVIFDNKLCLCNRGYGGGDDAIEVFELPSGLNQKQEFLEKLTEIYDSTEDLYAILEAYKFKKIGVGYHQKDQTSNNCVWASAKTTIGALCLLLFGLKEGKKAYKQFSTFCRLTSLNKYNENVKTPNPDLFNAIRLKVKEKTNEQLVQNTIEIINKSKNQKKENQTNKK